MSIGQNFKRVVQEVHAECERAGRNPEEVKLIAVSKTVEIAAIAQAIEAGAVDLAENRPERIVETAQTYPQATWHFIGNIQSRRIPDIVSGASLIHSVYQERHLLKIDKCAADLGKVQDVLIEVNVSGEDSKSGADPALVPNLVRATLPLEHVRVRGLMTMAPRGDKEATEATFKGLRALQEALAADKTIAADSAFISELSMGMSEDWRLAVANGATMIRIGRAIFSDSFM